jgi:hypothetical protein
MHDDHFDYIKNSTKTHQYVWCGSGQDQMETRSKDK